MAGLIKNEDIARVRESARIEDIVSEHVTLKPAGADSLSGLCPFHDEKTPSFHVRPSVGLFHCFGCGEGGDVITFVEKTLQLTFVEAVEYLAQRYGIELHYDEAERGKRRERMSARQTIARANDVAQAYFAQQLGTKAAQPARDFLTTRGFGPEVARDYGLGYAPAGWDNLLNHLRKRGFTEDELAITGLFSPGRRGPYDRFRNRLIWPIRDLTGAVIGFGARKLDEGEDGPKYLNTPETELYKKSQALYGIDRARKEIARTRRVVIVEGYTDVMAAHLAGVTVAVATCGTAFGAEHARLVRRLLGDRDDPAAGVVLSSGAARGGEVIFTFDGDEAGKAAAMKAFKEDQSFAAQTFVAVAEEGRDPCEVRLHAGDEAVRQLIASRVPLFEFVLRRIIDEHRLDTAEGRVQALRAAVPVVAGIRDHALRREYERMLGGWLGMPEAEVGRAIRAGVRRTGASAARSAGPAREDAITRMERQCLEAVIQRPHDIEGMGFDDLDGSAFVTPVYRAVHDAVRASGGIRRYGELRAFAESRIGIGRASAQAAQRRWLEEISAAGQGLVDQPLHALAVAVLPQDRPEKIPDYARDMVRAVMRLSLTRREGDLKGQLGRLRPGSEEFNAIFRELATLEARKRGLITTDT
ncbi:MAG: DNA primase [Actinomycetaceae bacterium]|nr:DNA primase [Actinomycetaceae bacterium]